MDPISLTASVAAILQLTAGLMKYLINVKQSSRESRELHIEACNLNTLLTNLKFRVEEAQQSDPWFNHIRLLGTENGPLDQFRNILETLVEKISVDTHEGHLMRTLRWKFTKEEVSEALDRIERLKSLINLALANDLFTLSQAIHANVINIEGKVLKMQNEIEGDLFHKFSNWLCTPDISINYNAALNKREPGTGLWLMNEARYQEWKQSAGKVMWLHGKPGCGKTVLSASVVSDLKSHIRSGGRFKLATFYFDFRDRTKQTSSTLIRSILLQLSFQIHGGTEVVQKLYSSCNDGKTQPPDDAVEVCLGHVMSSGDDIYIVIDALDECNDRSMLLRFIKDLSEQCRNGLHLLVTGRREYDIKDELLPILEFEIDIESSLVEDDIRLYIKESIVKDPKLNKWPISTKREIEERLMEKVDGMFRWAYCQLDSIRKCIKPSRLREALSSLPKTLDETYKTILERIEKEDQLEDAILVLQCLCSSNRPLRLPEVIEILAIDFDGSFSPEDRLPNPEDVMAICSSLISLKKQHKYPSYSDHGESYYHRYHDYHDRFDIEIQISHYSVKEYLLSQRNPYAHYFTPKARQTRLTQACLIYLVEVCSSSPLTGKTLKDRPFAAYSASEWWKHALFLRNELPDDILHYGLKLHEQPLLFNWIRLFDLDRWPLEYGKYHWPKEVTDPPAIYYAARTGLPQIVANLIEQGHDVDFVKLPRGTALKAVSADGHKEVVQLLLNGGADVKNTKGVLNEDALQMACIHGHIEIAQLLLNNGADVNVLGGRYGSALQAACAGGYLEVTRLLLNKGADVNIISGSSSSALQKACFWGHLEVARLLLNKGADVNVKHDSCGSALQVACYMGNLEVARLLLNNGADVNIQGGDYGSALQAACIEDELKLVRLLLNNGADVNVLGGAYCTALLAACTRGNLEMARLLLKKGADVNIQGGEFGSALQTACAQRKAELVQLLLDHGADINARGGEHGSALQVANSRGRRGIVMLLLANGADGADINAQDESFSEPEQTQID